jgi:hypothetical protein
LGNDGKTGFIPSQTITRKKKIRTRKREECKTAEIFEKLY